jgi:hypothetical protein
MPRRFRYFHVNGSAASEPAVAHLVRADQQYAS